MTDQGIEVSSLDRLRKQHAELRKERTLEIRIPGWNGLLWAVYTPVRAADMRKMAERINRLAGNGTVEDDLAAAADLIITACKEILTVVDGKKIPLAAEANYDEPIRFDDRLAEIAGFTAESARDVLFGVFPQFEDGSVIESTVNAHALEIADWISNVDQEVSDEFVGEF